ncbi:hypothetical protein ACFL04_01940 [Patescibacteria group bacterium]
MVTPEVSPSVEGETSSEMEYEVDLPNDDMRFFYRHDSEGQVALIRIVDANDNEVYTHNTEEHGPIDPEVLRKDLKSMDLQEVSVASIMEKVT